MEKSRFRIKKWVVVLIALFAACIVLNGAAWLSTDFSDWYRNNIFLGFQPIASGFSNLAPFSIGEILICIGIFGGIGMIISYIVLMICKKGKRRRISAVYGTILAWILAYITVTETLNCFIMYHCSTFASNYGISENTYTAEELYSVAMELAYKCREASRNVKRSGSDHLLTADVNSAAGAAMNGIADKYDTLSGYYPRAKAIDFSTLMTQFDLLGIYFPFSMEANYNPKMYSAELPSTVCHELAHLKGWIQEDEANFISYLACINSDEPDFVYSGYLSAVDYMRSKIYNDPSLTEEQYYEFLAVLGEDVIYDINESHRIFREAQSTKTGSAAAKVSDAAMEASLRLNGVSDGTKSYGRFVDLLLNYYLGNEDMI